MICPTCKTGIRKLKKNEVFDCRCGVKLLAIEINKKIIICDVTNKEER